jgi:hypothetical protein
MRGLDEAQTREENRANRTRKVGLDRAAVTETFGEFLSGSTATAAQIGFANMIVEHLTDQGVLDPALLYDPPFTDLARRAPISCSVRKGHAPVCKDRGNRSERSSLIPQ